MSVHLVLYASLSKLIDYAHLSKHDETGYSMISDDVRS